MHVEEVVLATSGEDAFELVFAVAASRLLGKDAARTHPELGVTVSLAKVDRSVLARIRLKR